MFWVWTDGRASRANSSGRGAPRVDRPELRTGARPGPLSVGVASMRAHRIRWRGQVIARRTDRCFASGHERIRFTLVSMDVRTRVAASSNRFHVASGVRALRCHDSRIRSGSEGQQRRRFVRLSNATRHERSGSDGCEDGRRSTRCLDEVVAAAASSHAHTWGSSQQRPYVGDSGIRKRRARVVCRACARTST